MDEEKKLREENFELKRQLADNNRKYMPTLGELIDRLSITQLKEFLIPEHRKEYSDEIRDILHDIDIIIDSRDLKMNAQVVRAILVLAIMNREIWLNESNCRKGIKDANNLFLSHGLNSVRNDAKNRIQSLLGGRMDYKLDVIDACSNFIPSWNHE